MLKSGIYKTFTVAIETKCPPKQAQNREIAILGQFQALVDQLFKNYLVIS